MEPVDYSGAVYGSLLAGSVVAGSAPGQSPSTPALMTALLATGLVFWLAHAYARLAGDQAGTGARGWAEVKAVCRAEWPLAQAAIPPAMVAGLGWLLGLAESTTAWLCLLVAVVGQVGWAVKSAIGVGATRRYAVLSGVVNLGLGLIIIVLKATLAH